MPKMRTLLSFGIAHRGAHRRAPENTLAALRAAKKAGAQWVECDVQLTRDREAVIFHDATLDRMTNGSGYVSQSSLSKIKSLRCKKETIPTLLEWLCCCLELNINLNLEMKAHTQKQARLLANCVLRDLKKTRFPISKLLISSFYIGCLMEISKKNKKIPLAFNTDKKISDKTIQKLSAMHFFSVHQHYPLLNKNEVDRLHQNGFRVLAYTVNDRVNAERLKSMGVDAIFTDNEKMYCLK